MPKCEDHVENWRSDDILVVVEHTLGSRRGARGVIQSDRLPVIQRPLNWKRRVTTLKELLVLHELAIPGKKAPEIHLSGIQTVVDDDYVGFF